MDISYPDSYTDIMIQEPSRSTLFDLVAVLSEAMDLVNPLVVDHHRLTAWFAAHIAEQMGLSEDELSRVIIAALLHDVGAFSLKERLDTLHFEFENPHHHARLGHRLLHDFGPLKEEAGIILGHHAWWKPEKDDDPGGDQVPGASHIIHLADRIAILISGAEDGRVGAEDVLKAVEVRDGTVFMPDAVEAFRGLASLDGFWQDASGTESIDLLKHKVAGNALVLDTDDLERLARMFAKIIDYRSHFTATHSAGVAGVAEALAGLLGFSDDHRQIIRVAGYLHDLGKLTIPTELIEKPGQLDDLEYLHVQDHAVQTRRFLERIPELGYGIEWAAQHHERLDGSGYPEHSTEQEIAFGSRVVAVADIFTAVTEDRPYREGMDRDDALQVLTQLTDGGYLDPEVFGAAVANFEELNAVRLDVQAEAEEDYRCRVGEIEEQESEIRNQESGG